MQLLPQMMARPAMCGNGKGRAQADIVGRKAEQAGDEGPVRTVTLIGLGKRTIDSDDRLFRFIFQDFPGHEANPGGTCRVGTGRPDHDRADHIKNSHEKTSLQFL